MFVIPKNLDISSTAFFGKNLQNKEDNRPMRKYKETWLFHYSWSTYDCKNRNKYSIRGISSISLLAWKAWMILDTAYSGVTMGSIHGNLE